MRVTEKILFMAKENNGIVTTSMAIDAGFSKGNLTYLVKRGQLEKTARGVYILPDVMEDEFVTMQSRFKRGIFSHETALFLYDLTDYTPNRFHMTFPATYNVTKPKQAGIRCSQVVSSLYEIGMESVSSPSGNQIRAYCMERTLCDILKLKKQTDIQVISQAFKQYAQRNDRNIPRLSEYAKLLHVEDKVRAYMEVLL